MGEIVVKHFKRSGISSDDKELITEIVVESSDTGRFLRRVEESRLTRPCFQTIDLRGRVAGECHRYAFNDRVHYLDELAFQIFEQGLREHNGVYTVGTFEEIMGCTATLEDQQTKSETLQRRRDEVEQQRRERTCTTAPGGAGGEDRKRGSSECDAAAVLVENPQLLPLGYFRRRGHPRLCYACAVVLQRGNIRVNGITGDISVSGVRVHAVYMQFFNICSKPQKSV